jgi:succinate dehydrogenase / fumarate reductase membrane anchor subunit
MRYMTDRKRALGLGASNSGVHHFWMMKVSSVALLLLIPLFIFTFGPMIGESHATVVAYFSHPFPAIVAALTIVVGFKHFNDGAQVMIEDYVHGLAQKVTIVLVTCLSYAAAATGLFAIVKIAL